MVPVILSGGSGTRLWPLSRGAYPKQFLPLTGEQTMLQMTLRRLEGLEEVSAPVIVCNEEHRFLVAEQLRQMGIQARAIIREPDGRNTAPAVALAALELAEVDPSEPMLVLPADHVIEDVEAFQAAVRTALDAARKGALVTFGIVPDSAETGYGYIRAEGDGDVRKVLEFKEKPDLATAELYVESGDYFWNSGMFLFRADRYLEELERHAPDILEVCRSTWERRREDDDFVRLPREVFMACRSDSIDYAVMENTDRAVMVPLDAGWNDLGSWSALQDVDETDENGNVLRGDVLVLDTHNSYIRSEGRLVATVGVDDVVVVETSDAVLVAHRDRVQDVKEVVTRLKELEREEPHHHRCVYRPWGSYETLAITDRFQVKHIVVNPGASLSLQMHHHRAEHWIVVKGTAKVTRGEESFLLGEDQSTYIPLGTLHRLENPGVIPLHLIEVQSGSYLGEDDIVRFEDVYGRDGKQG